MGAVAGGETAAEPAGVDPVEAGTVVRVDDTAGGVVAEAQPVRTTVPAAMTAAVTTDRGNRDLLIGGS